MAHWCDSSTQPVEHDEATRRLGSPVSNATSLWSTVHKRSDTTRLSETPYQSEASESAPSMTMISNCTDSLPSQNSEDEAPEPATHDLLQIMKATNEKQVQMFRNTTLGALAKLKPGEAESWTSFQTSWRKACKAVEQAGKTKKMSGADMVGVLNDLHSKDTY